MVERARPRRGLLAPEYTPQTPADFRNFLFMVWKHLRLPKPTELQYEIAYFLQHGPKRFVVEGLRGIGKSWITSAFVCWLLDQHPDWNILVVSASKNRADDFSTFTLRLIREMPCLQHLAPLEGQRDSKIAFDVAPAPAAHAPSVKSLGITSQLTGNRADVVIADDVEVPNNSMTQLMRDKLSEAVKEFDSILKPGDHARIVFLGTPQTEQSLYDKLSTRGYKIMVWPAEYPDEKRLAMYGNRLAPSIHKNVGKLAPGTPTDPTRFDAMDLAERRLSYGAQGYALQFLLDTTLSDVERYPLKLRDLIVMNCNPDEGPEKVVWAASPELSVDDLPNLGFSQDRYYRPMAIGSTWYPYQGCVMSIDPAGMGKDELGYCVIKMLHGFLYVVACGGLRGGYVDANLTFLAQIAKKHKANNVIVEENFGDGMFTALLKPVLQIVYPVTIEDVKHSKQKELRILDVLEPVISGHKLVVDKAVIEADYASAHAYGSDNAQRYTLAHQLTRITRERHALAHDDRLDALAIAVAYWVEQMSKPVGEAVQDAKDEALDKELERFMEHAIGFKPRSKRSFAR
jgi:hypothetical protein